MTDQGKNLKDKPWKRVVSFTQHALFDSFNWSIDFLMLHGVKINDKNERNDGVENVFCFTWAVSMLKVITDW